MNEVASLFWVTNIACLGENITTNRDNGVRALIRTGQTIMGTHFPTFPAPPFTALASICLVLIAF